MKELLVLFSSQVNTWQNLTACRSSSCFSILLISFTYIHLFLDFASTQRRPNDERSFRWMWTLRISLPRRRLSRCPWCCIAELNGVSFWSLIYLWLPGWWTMSMLLMKQDIISASCFNTSGECILFWLRGKFFVPFLESHYDNFFELMNWIFMW